MSPKVYLFISVIIKLYAERTHTHTPTGIKDTRRRRGTKRGILQQAEPESLFFQ